MAKRTKIERPKCRMCGLPLRRYRHRDEEWGKGREWGDYGDGHFCGLRCGYEFGVIAATKSKESFRKPKRIAGVEETKKRAKERRDERRGETDEERMERILREERYG